MTFGLSPFEVRSMGGAVTATALSMRCTVERFTAGAPDPYGQPTGSWAPVLVNVPCLFWTQDRVADAEREGPSATFAAASQMLEFAPNTDIRESDRITTVEKPILGAGARVVWTLLATALEITEVRQRETDTVAAVRDVR